MIPNEIELLARAWVNMHLAAENSGEYSDNFWAYTSLSELCEKDPQSCWAVIKCALRMDASDEILSNLSAGPLEDLLAQNGKEIIDVLERDAHSDMRIRKLVSGVWRNDIETSIWNRVQRLTSDST